MKNEKFFAEIVKKIKQLIDMAEIDYDTVFVLKDCTIFVSKGNNVKEALINAAPIFQQENTNLKKIFFLSKNFFKLFEDLKNEINPKIVYDSYNLFFKFKSDKEIINISYYMDREKILRFESDINLKNNNKFKIYLENK